MVKFIKFIKKENSNKIDYVNVKVSLVGFITLSSILVLGIINSFIRVFFE